MTGDNSLEMVLQRAMDEAWCALDLARDMELAEFVPTETFIAMVADHVTNSAAALKVAFTVLAGRLK